MENKNKIKDEKELKKVSGGASNGTKEQRDEWYESTMSNVNKGYFHVLAVDSKYAYGHYFYRYVNGSISYDSNFSKRLDDMDWYVRVYSVDSWALEYEASHS